MRLLLLLFALAMAGCGKSEAPTPGPNSQPPATGMPNTNSPEPSGNPIQQAERALQKMPSRPDPEDPK